MKTSTALATALLVASTVSGWDVEKRCGDLPDLCFLSFIWCDFKSPGHCSLPPEVYPQFITSNTEYPIILVDTNYTVKWLAKQGNDEPVTFQWTMNYLTWETNVTGTEFVFNANDIINSFPTEKYPNAGPADAWYAASRSPENIFSITRAKTEGNVGYDFSQQFMVQPGILKNYLETQRKIEYNKWRLPVGLSVGLGVPFLLVVTAAVTWLVCRRTMKKPESKPVELNPQ
ncbi:hypothetical protein F4802DRAFT_102973 [Xylaria palmicola]|nr:hypothetical protein F4802DRAFT_102973 [Xylaria palmicola]